MAQRGVDINSRRRYRIGLAPLDRATSKPKESKLDDLEKRWQCTHCKVAFSGDLLTLNVANERVRFGSATAPDRVEIRSARGTATCCSHECFNAHLPIAMGALEIPIPSESPSIGPVESCAKCDQPVDMSDWHVTVTASREQELDWGLQPIAVEYVAVLCRPCSQHTAVRGNDQVLASSAPWDRG